MEEEEALFSVLLQALKRDAQWEDKEEAIPLDMDWRKGEENDNGDPCLDAWDDYGEDDSSFLSYSSPIWNDNSPISGHGAYDENNDKDENYSSEEDSWWKEEPEDEDETPLWFPTSSVSTERPVKVRHYNEIMRDFVTRLLGSGRFGWSLPRTNATGAIQKPGPEEPIQRARLESQVQLMNLSKEEKLQQTKPPQLWEGSKQYDDNRDNQVGCSPNLADAKDDCRMDLDSAASTATSCVLLAVQGNKSERGGKLQKRSVDEGRNRLSKTETEVIISSV